MQNVSEWHRLENQMTQNNKAVEIELYSLGHFQIGLEGHSRHVLLIADQQVKKLKVQ